MENILKWFSTEESFAITQTPVLKVVFPTLLGVSGNPAHEYLVNAESITFR